MHREDTNRSLFLENKKKIKKKKKGWLNLEKINISSLERSLASRIELMRRINIGIKYEYAIFKDDLLATLYREESRLNNLKRGTERSCFLFFCVILLTNHER